MARGTKPIKHRIHLYPFLIVASLAVIPPAMSQELDTANPDPAGATQVGQDVLKPRDPDPYLSKQRKAADREREHLIHKLGKIQQKIAELEQELKGIAQEKQTLLQQISENDERLDDLAREIDDVEDEIDDVEATIAVSASFGFVDPGLVAHVDSLKDRLHSLREEREAIQSQTSAIRRQIDELDASARDVEKQLQTQRQWKSELEREMTEVVVMKPSEGARLLVGSEQTLLIRVYMPPRQMRIEIQKEHVRGGETPNNPLKKVWEPVYERTWEWSDLELTGSSLASFRFRTVELVSGHALAPDPSTLRLDPGDYRAKVERVGPRNLDVGTWKTFSVVGRLGGEILRQPAPQPGTIKLRPGAKPRP
ncbi:MAG: hypothetical protein P8Y29_03775 [Gemmatimonadota bacterium]